LVDSWLNETKCVEHMTCFKQVHVCAGCWPKAQLEKNQAHLPVSDTNQQTCCTLAAATIMITQHPNTLAFVWDCQQQDTDVSSTRLTAQHRGHIKRTASCCTPARCCFAQLCAAAAQWLTALLPASRPGRRCLGCFL
jgi:hypothetical protein